MAVDYALVPRHYRRGAGGAPDQIVLWAGAMARGSAPRPPQGELQLGDACAPVPWRHAFEGRVYTDEIAVPLPAQVSEARLVIDGVTRATARVGAPPGALPGPGERPFTVLVGSCYCVANDRDARLARAAALLARENASPDVKFLCGDQVYIDTPPNYAWAPRERAELLDKFLGDYIDTWSERGLLPLLRQGATYFTSDDHEFWNEYPAMRGQGGRTPTWESLARGLFEVFQRREDPEPLDACGLSFFALDTRLDRDETLDRFAPPARLAALEAWLGSLQGPGVLVLGETFFGEKRSVGVSLTRLVGDLISQPTISGTLVEFAQYRELAALLARSKKTVILVAGDVHWGRIADCRLPNGTRLLEVVSSPLTLVDGGLSRLGRPWTRAPSPFEAGGLSGEVHTVGGSPGHPYKAEHDHFCTLEFSRPAAGPGVHLAVRHWSVDAHQRTGDIVFETTL